MLASLGAEEINRRFAVADRYLRDSGVFYRVYEDPAGAERPWPLSHMPLIINPAEWAALKSGLIQRAELLELVLADAYGAATIVRDGLVPAVLIAGNPEFLRPLAGRGAARRRASAVLCGRCRARRRWPLVGAGRSHPGAFGRRLRAGEPARLAARHPGGLSRHQGRAAGAVLPGLPVGAVELQPPGRFARLPAHARADERVLFRARLSGALSRLAAGRRRGPDRARRRRLHPHGLRPEAGRGAAAPPRCRFLRSAGAQCALAPRRHRPGADGARRQGRHRQFARGRTGRGALDAGLSAGAGAGPARRRARHPQHRDLVARSRATRATRWSASSTRW